LARKDKAMDSLGAHLERWYQDKYSCIVLSGGLNWYINKANVSCFIFCWSLKAVSWTKAKS